MVMAWRICIAGKAGATIRLVDGNIDRNVEKPLTPAPSLLSTESQLPE
jgi:hypothetical protein